jgi:hypothetical protein
MSNYTLQFSSATYSTTAAALVLAAVMAAKPQVEAMDSIDTGRSASTMIVGAYRESGTSPTVMVNLGEAVGLDVHRYLGDASQLFVTQLSGGMQPLGADFAEILEDNFWDLVLG